MNSAMSCAPAGPLHRLTLIRHGQTSGNGSRYVGREDLALDDAGHAQARALADALSERAYQLIVCSPLLRARQTAAPLLQAMRDAGLETTLWTHPGLMEIDYGDFQGLLKHELRLKLRHRHLHTPMPGGESLAEVYARVNALARELAEPVVQRGPVAVVGHFWSNRLLRGALLGLDLEQTLAQRDYKPGNGSFVHLELAQLAAGPAHAAS